MIKRFEVGKSYRCVFCEDFYQVHNIQSEFLKVYPAREPRIRVTVKRYLSWTGPEIFDLMLQSSACLGPCRVSASLEEGQI